MISQGRFIVQDNAFLNFAREQLVENGSERINVAVRPNLILPTGRLLRWHVAGTAHHRARLRQTAVRARVLGRAEIGHAGHAHARFSISEDFDYVPSTIASENDRSH